MNYGLSFIGTGDYKEVSYKYLDKEIRTNLFPFAFCKFFSIDTLFLVVTEKAKEKHLAQLKLSFQNESYLCTIKEINIPYGQNEEELWEIFEIITNSLPDNIEIYYDITHSFRSIPFITLSICNYISLFKNIHIKKIVYGAFEATDTEFKPVFDLTPFLELIDWANSTSQFIKFGNSQGLRNLLEQIHKRTYITKSSYQSKSLASFGETLQKLTTALSLSRIEDSTYLAKDLINSLVKIEEEIKHLPNSKPLGNLLNKIKERFFPLVLGNLSLFSKQGFNAQLKMIDFYLDTENYMQAISLAREIFVSYLTMTKNLNPRKKTDREKVEEELAELKKSFLSNLKLDKEQQNIAKLWTEISNLRNDIDHCGMYEKPIECTKAIEKIRYLCEKVGTFLTSRLNNGL